MTRTKIKIEANIAASCPDVWERMTSPKHITKWNFASDDWHCPTAANDLKVGGKYSARMEAKNGSFGFEFVAVYDEVVNQKKIVYTMEDGRQVVTTFEPHGSGTKVVTVFDAEDQHPEELQKQGWQAILNNFKKYAESH